MYSSLVSVTGSGLDKNVDTFPERAGGPHFGGAPAAVVNPGPTSDAGMSVFGSRPSGELLSSAADDALYAEQVAPVMKSFAVYTKMFKDASGSESKVLRKGTVVTITSKDPINDAAHYTGFEKRATRAGLTLQRLACQHCSDSVLGGIVGVLAETAIIRRDQYAVVTVAFENATELSPEYLLESKEGKRAKEQDKLDYVLPGQMLRIGTNNVTNATYRKVTVLTGWTRGQEIGPLVCLHPGLFKV